MSFFDELQQLSNARTGQGQNPREVDFDKLWGPQPDEEQEQPPAAVPEGWDPNNPFAQVKTPVTAPEEQEDTSFFGSIAKFLSSPVPGMEPAIPTGGSAGIYHAAMPEAPDPADLERATPEGIQRASERQQYLEELAKQGTAYEELFAPGEQNAVRLGIGHARKLANAAARELAELKESIAGWKQGSFLDHPVYLTQPSGYRTPLNGSPARGVELAIQQAEERIRQLEVEYEAAANAAQKPTLRTDDGDFRVIPGHPYMQALQEANAAGDQDLVNAILVEFFPTIVAEVGLPSITQAGFSQLLIPGGAAAGIKAVTQSTNLARLGFASAQGTVSGQVEQQAAFTEFLAEKGVNTTDKFSVSMALEDPDLVKEAREFAWKRGLGVGLWDALGATLASRKILPPVFKSKLAQNISEFGTQFAAQAFTGAAGEAQAQAFAGQEFDPLQMKLEAIGEFTTAPVEIATFALAEKYGKAPEEIKSHEDVLRLALEHAEERSAQLVESLREMYPDLISQEDAELMLHNLDGYLALDGSPMDRVLGGEQGAQSYGYDQMTELRKVINKHFYEAADGTERTYDQVRERGPEEPKQVFWQRLVAQGSNTTSEIRELREEIRQLTNNKQKAESQGQAAAANIIAVNLNAALRRLGRLETRTAAWAQMRDSFKEIVAEVWEKYGNGDLIIVDDSKNLDTAHPTLGGYSLAVNSQGRKVSVIQMATLAIMRKKRSGIDPVQSTAAWAAVLFHELGHGIMISNYSRMPEGVRNAVQQAHREWLQDLLGRMNRGELKTMEDFYLTKKSPASIFPLYGEGIRKAKPEDDLSKTYDYSFDEFWADMISRAHSRPDTVPNSVVRRVAKVVAQKLEDFFNAYKDRMNLRPDETVDKFLDYMHQQSIIEHIKRIQGTLTPEELASPAGANAQGMIQTMKIHELDLPEEVVDQLQEQSDRYNWVMRFGLTLLQLGKENPHIKGLQDYIEAVHLHWVTKSNWNNQAMKTINAWRKLGRKEADQLGEIMLEATLLSDKLQRKLTNDEFQELLDKSNYTLTDEAWQVYKDIKGDLRNALEEMYLIEKARINRDYADFETQRLAKIAELDSTFSKLRDRDYFPLSRFGEYSITLRAKRPLEYNGAKYKEGEVVYFEIFENERQRKKAQGRLLRDIPGTKAELDKIDDTLKQFAGLPATVLRNLRDNPKLGLTEDQKTQINKMLDRLSLTNNIAKRMLERKGTPGFSLDAMRAYAHYMQGIGSHIAREQHVGQMEEAIDSVDRSAVAIGRKGVSNTKRRDIAAHLRRHMEYIMKPVNEWGGLRTLAFVWFLGYNVKSAFVNLTQIPLVAYPYLAARKELTGNLPVKSDAAAMAALAKAGHDVKMFYQNTRSNYTTDEQEMISILQAEGIIDESLATELAGEAHADAMQRIMPGANIYTDRARHAGAGFIRGSTYLFQAAEKYNRRVVALATFRLAKGQGMSNRQATAEAREALRTTQFEYARWNRAAFMRGKASVLTVFMSYLQNILYFTGREPGKWRYLAMLFLAAGLQGLPGAEDLLDMFDFGRSWWRRRTLDKDPHSSARKDLRDFIIELDLNPDLIMHGLGSESMGLSLPTVSDMLGTSIPSFTFEGSLSSGRIIPGLEAMLRPTPLSGPGSVEAAKDVLGAAFTIPISIARAIASDDPEQLRNLEMAAPSVLRGAARALRVLQDGALENRGGDQLYPFDRTNPEHIAELVGMGVLGMQPTRLTRENERNFAKLEALNYYKHLRSIYTNNWIYAYEQRRKHGDQKALDAAMGDIRKFNKVAPKGQQIINPAEALIRRRMGNARYGVGVPDRIMDTPASREIDRAYPRVTSEPIK